MTDADLALRLSRDLGALATDAQWATSGDQSQPQGHYTDPIADAKAAIGIADLPDATAEQLRRVRLAALAVCFDRLEAHYAALVNTKGAELNVERLLDNCRSLRLQLVGSIAVGVALRGQSRPDYTLGGGDAT